MNGNTNMSLEKPTTILEKEKEGVVKSPDFYFDSHYADYLAHDPRNGLHLNHASLTRPCEASERAALETFEKKLSEEEKRSIFEEARKKAAHLIGIDERGVAFGRNTTEAISFCFWLAGLQEGDGVLLTDAENRSIKRTIETHMDHSNPEHTDPWSTYPTYYARRGQKYESPAPYQTGVHTVTIEAIHADDEEIYEEIRAAITPETKCVVISHVLRDTGRELPVAYICRYIREQKKKISPADPEIFIVVDGAQALGNLDEILFEEIGCDAYVATPHKTMASTPLGLLYFDRENPRIQENLLRFNTLSPREQIILRGAFHPALQIEPNVDDEIEPADVAGFLAAIEFLEKRGYRDGNFHALNEHREKLKTLFMEKLRETVIFELGLAMYEVGENTNFIAGFSVVDIDNRELAKRLAQKGIFVSYIDRTKLQDEEDAYSGDGIVRVSFSITNTPKEINTLFPAFKETLNELKQEKIHAFQEVEDAVLLKPEARSGFMGWISKQARSGIGQISLAATSLTLLFGSIKALDDSRWSRMRLDPTFLAAEDDEAEVKTKIIAEYERRLKTLPQEDIQGWFGLSYANWKPIEEGLLAKHTFLANLKNHRVIADLFEDTESLTAWNIRNARYTLAEREAIKKAYQATHDPNIASVVAEIEGEERRGIPAVIDVDEWFIGHMQEKIDKCLDTLQYYAKLEAKFDRSDTSVARWRIIENEGMEELELKKYQLLHAIYDPQQIETILNDGTLFLLPTFVYTPEERRQILQAHRSHGALGPVVSAMLQREVRLRERESRIKKP